MAAVPDVSIEEAIAAIDLLKPELTSPGSVDDPLAEHRVTPVTTVKQGKVFLEQRRLP